MILRNQSGKALQVILVGMAVVLALVALVVLGGRAAINPDRVSEDAKLRLDHDSGDTKALKLAANELRVAIALHPESAPAWAQYARVARKMAHQGYDQYDPRVLAYAHKFAQKALEIDPRCHAALYAESRTYLAEDDIPSAEGFAARMDEAQPGTVDSHLMWAAIRIKSKRFDEARAHAVAVLEASDDSLPRAEALGDLAEVASAYGDWAGADSCYLATIQLRPGDAWARGNYADYLIGRDRYDDALAWSDSALATMDYPMGHHIRASARFWRAMNWIQTEGKWKDADKEFRACVAEDSVNALGWYGIAFIERGRYEKSQKPTYLVASNAALAKAKAIDPTIDAIADLEAMNAGDGRNLTR